MKIILITISLFLLTSVSYSGIEVFSTKKECWDRSAELSVEEQSHFYCYVDSNPTQRQEKEQLKHEINERIKAGYPESIRSAKNLSDLTYDIEFDKSTTTDLGNGTEPTPSQEGFAGNTTLLLGGLAALTMLLLAGVIRFFKKT